MKTIRGGIILALLVLNAVCVENTQAQWYPQNSGMTTGAFYGVDFVDLNTGYVVGLYKTILKTTDGGLKWSLLLRDTTATNWLKAVDFVNADTGTVVGQNTILRTTDGGMSWTQQNPPYGGDGVSFVGARMGLIAISGGIRRTTNGGDTWTYVSVSSAGLNAVDLVDPNLAFAVGNSFQFSRNIYRSTNGGLNWQTVGGVLGDNLHSVSFANTLIGIAVGDFGDIFVTTNGGDGWMLKGRELPGGAFRSVSMSDERNATAVGAVGLIVRTTNGGFNWAIQESGTNNHLHGVTMVDSLNGWAVGSYGTILHTSNGGGLVGVEQHEEKPTTTMLWQNYPNPFNPTTNIDFDVPVQSTVTLKVYNLLGQEIATLFNGNAAAGTHHVAWNGKDNLGSTASSGVYFYRIEASTIPQAQKFVRVQKMLMMK